MLIPNPLTSALVLEPHARHLVPANVAQFVRLGGTLLELLQSNAPSPIEKLEAKEQAVWIRSAVDHLPEDLRVVLLLTYFQGLTFREAAEVLDIPLGTVKSRVHKALYRLNSAWRSQLFTDS